MCSERKGKQCVCLENRSPTGLVSFNMQNTEFVLREIESCASFVLVVLAVCVCNSPDFQAHIDPSFVFFFLGSISQPRPHYPFSCSIMVQGLLNFFSPGTKFRKFQSYSRTWSNDYKYLAYKIVFLARRDSGISSLAISGPDLYGTVEEKPV